MVSGTGVNSLAPLERAGAITDAHVHVVSSDVLRYPRRAGGPGRDWWTDRAVDGDSILGDLEDAGVLRAVLVQAIGAYGNDNRYARSVVESHPDKLVLVPVIDSNSEDPAAELVALMDQGSVAGVRLVGVDGEPAWLGDGRGRAVWEVAGECDITLVLTLFPGHLEPLRILATQEPEARVALDHCAFPNLRSGPPYPEAAGLFALAECSSVHLKITSIVLRQATERGTPASLVEQLVELFGPDRLCWGSDHPQTIELLYPEMVELAVDAVRTLDAAAQHSILDRTARRLFWGDRT